MHRTKQNIASASSQTRFISKRHKPSTPYDQLPIALRSQHMRPFSQILHNCDYNLQRKEKVRNITSHTLERDFKNQHNIHQYKESQLLKSFKVRCKRREVQSKTITNEDFIQGLLKDRQAEQSKLHGEYLAVLRQQVRRCKKEQLQSDMDAKQKLICEYNIVYEYRCENLPNPFRCIRK